VQLGKGDGTFQVANYYGVGFGPGSVTVGDFNADSKPDLAVANFGSANVSVLLNNCENRSAPEQLADLIALVHGMSLDMGIENALVVKLQAALMLINSDHESSACSVLRSLLNQIAAQEFRGKITAAQDEVLIREATRIRVVLGCLR
jgi:hypothetical protein